MKWYYDACGEYTLYKRHVVIKQEHPKLDKYAIYFEEVDRLPEPVLTLFTTTSPIEQFKQIINDKIKQHELDKKTI